jgi:hypothetical protein
MDMRTRTILLWSGVAILIVAGLAMLLLSFGGSEENTPADDIDVAYTNAASTVAAQQQTLQAEISSVTPNPALSLPTATLPATFQQQTPLPLPTIKPPAVVVTTACDSAVYISDVTVPDGTTIPAGEYFTKTWKVTNTGSCIWTATYQLVFVSGDSLGGKATPIGKVVNPGESADISVVLTSSSATGSIKGTWKLSNDKGLPFGDSLTVVINSGTVTASATSTEVIIATATSFTATTAPVATTAVPTDTPVPTATLP